MFPYKPIWGVSLLPWNGANELLGASQAHGTFVNIKLSSGDMIEKQVVGG